MIAAGGTHHLRTLLVIVEAATHGVADEVRLAYLIVKAFGDGGG